MKGPRGLGARVGMGLQGCECACVPMEEHIEGQLWYQAASVSVCMSKSL